MTDLKTTFAGLQLKNPIIISSSGLTNSAGKNKKLAEAGAGAIVLKSLFEEQIFIEADQLKDPTYSEGNDYLAEYIREHKLSEYLELIKESKKVCDIPIIASINCYTDSEWINFAKQIEEAGADALEINILALQSDVQYKYGSFEQRHIDILSHIKRVVKLPVIMKLGDNLTNPVTLIDQLYANGAAAVVLFNRFYQPDINIENMEHMSGEIFSQITNAANKRNLRDSTIHAYCTSVAHFLKYTDKPIDALTTDDVDTFLTEKRLSGISPETYNHYHSGIRFFYKKVLKMNWDDDDIPRMKRDRNLPTVLTKAEISAILDATPNLKHKAMIATMYSGGLRVSEVTHLHYDDISRTNKTIHIRDGKSRFDRYTLLADRTLEILTEYWFKCGRPTGILFPSSWSGDYLVKDSVIQFFRKSAKRAGIQKHVSTHCLRHSFASHLFEAGCDVKYIQALLGHRDPRSTEIYLHVSNKTLLGIKSPFDEMGGE